MIESTDAPTNIVEDGGGGSSGGNAGNSEIRPGSDIIPKRDYRLFNNGGTYGIIVELKGAIGSYNFLVTKKAGPPSPHDVGALYITSPNIHLLPISAQCRCQT